MTMTGHAGYAKRGYDIICAAVSLLLYLQVRLLEEDDLLADLQVEEAYVRLEMKEGGECPVLELGLRWLCGEYPQYVTVKN